MNVKLLRRIQRVILKRYKQLNMRLWFQKGAAVPECGTTACIAGWALACQTSGKKKVMPRKAALLVNKRFDEDGGIIGCESSHTMVERGAKALTLDCKQAKRLFYNDEWPNPFYNALRQLTPGTKAYAEVVSERINHFIDTNGQD